MNELRLRACEPADRDALRRLAERDSAAPLGAGVLAAEAGSELVAAICLRSGRVVADPFRPTAEAVELLRRRRSQLRRGGPHARSLPFLARILGRAAAGSARA